MRSPAVSATTQPASRSSGSGAARPEPGSTCRSSEDVENLEGLEDLEDSLDLYLPLF
jgi:hypothetical protein